MISAETYNHDYEIAYKAGYDKAIDDFVKYANEKLDIRFALDYLAKDLISEIAEQLKGEKE